MRILVTGSRKLTDRLLVQQELSRFAPANGITLITGYDPDKKTPTGADQFAYEFAEKKWNWTNENYPADWERECDQNCYHRTKFRPVEIDGVEVLVPYCPVAGNLRNQVMVDSTAHVCLAFYKFSASNRGTADCVRRARKAGIRIHKFWEP